jgi:hypothetical protein
MVRSEAKAPVMAAIVAAIIGIGIFFLITSLPGTAPTSAVEGKEAANTQPAGPADKQALPGQSDR